MSLISLQTHQKYFKPPVYRNTDKSNEMLVRDIYVNGNSADGEDSYSDKCVTKEYNRKFEARLFSAQHSLTIIDLEQFQVSHAIIRGAFSMLGVHVGAKHSNVVRQRIGHYFQKFF